MTFSMLRLGLVLAPLGLAGCAASGTSLPQVLDITPTPRPNVETAQQARPLDGMIAKYASAYDVPVKLVHHVVRRESNYNPKAYRNGNYGLMQIRYRTAKGMGYRGSPKGLYDPETNLKYAVKYLRGAYVTARGDQKEADWLYRTGYYYVAKRRGLLAQAGMTRAGTAATQVAEVKAPAAPPANEIAKAAAELQPTRIAAATTQSDDAEALPGVYTAAADDVATPASLGGVAQTAPASMAFAGTTPTSVPVPSFRPTR